MATTRARSSRKATQQPAATPTLEVHTCGPTTCDADDPAAQRRFVDGQSVLLVRAEASHVALLSEGLWLRVRLIGPDWFALSAK